jgi:hypothetical protein
MLDHRQLLDRDVFSFTRAGAPYVVGEWLGQITLALAYRAGGWTGLVVLRAALVAIGTFFAARAVLRAQPHVGWAAAPLLAVILVSSIEWGDRPQLFTFALFPLFLDMLLGSRAESTRRLWLLPALLLVWVNLHGGFMLGLGLLAIFAAEAILTRAESSRRFVVALALGALAVQVNPSGPAAVVHALVHPAAARRAIVEEGPTDILSGAGIVFALLLVAALAIALAAGADGIAARIGSPLLWAGLVIPFGLLGLGIQRALPLSAVVLAPFVAAGIPMLLERPAAQAPVVPRAAAAGVLAALAFGIAVTAALAAPREADLSSYPVGALPRLRSEAGHLLNEHDWGGFLIRSAPEHPTFIDGRGYVLFPPEIFDDFDVAVRLRPGYRDVLRRWDITLVLLRPYRPLVGALREDGWRVVAEEARWVLLAAR